MKPGSRDSAHVQEDPGMRSLLKKLTRGSNDLNEENEDQKAVWDLATKELFDHVPQRTQD
jgi:hypothetical protein